MFVKITAGLPAQQQDHIGIIHKKRPASYLKNGGPNRNHNRKKTCKKISLSGQC